MSDAVNIRLLFDGMRVGDIMRTPVVTITENSSLAKALQQFSEQRVNHLIVVDDAGRLMGLLSHKYFYRTRSPRKRISDDLAYDPDLVLDGTDGVYERSTLNSYSLKNVMKRNPFYLHPKDSVSKAVLNMHNKNLACIPIVDDNLKVKGVVTDRDILSYLSALLEE